MALYPTDMSDMIYNMELVDYAVRLWKASNSPTPPLPNELLYRDRTWDYQCTMVANAYDFKLKQKEGKDTSKP